MISAAASDLLDVATDPVHVRDLIRLAEAEGVHGSLLMPTRRRGPETRRSGKLFAGLCDELRRATVERGIDTSLVERIAGVAHGHDFWQHQGEGLAVVAGPSHTFVRRLNAPVRPEVTIGRPRLRPLLSHLTTDTVFHVLALSTGRVRLFEGSEHSMCELPLGPVPSSYEELTSDRDRQQSLQWSSQSGDANFHGHGGDAAADRTWTEKFFRLVSHELRRHLPPGRSSAGPLVLACVPENLALFRDAGGHPRLLNGSCIPGNADRTSPAELHARAWPLVQPYVRREERAALAQTMELHGTGRVLTDFDHVLMAAWEGRVEWLFVGQSPWAPDDDVTVVDDPVDLVMCRVLVAGGHCAVRPDTLAGGAGELTALLRW